MHSFAGDLQTNLEPGEFLPGLLSIGLDRRLTAASTLLSMQSGSTSRFSGFKNRLEDTSVSSAALLRQRVVTAKGVTPEGQLLAYLINTSCARRNVSQQVDYIYQIASLEEQQKVMPLAVGRLLSPHGLALPPLHSLGSDDYSLIVQSVLFARDFERSHQQAWSMIARAITELRRLLSAKTIRNFSGIKAFLERLGHPLHDDSLSEFRRALSQAKRGWWPILGADLFSFLQALSDPTHILTKVTLERLNGVFRLWQIDRFSNQLIALRAVTGAQGEREYLKANWEQIESHIHPKLRQVVSSSINDRPIIGTRPSSLDFLSRSISLASEIDRGINRRSASDLKHCVIRAYQHDPYLCGFFGWDRINNILSTNWIAPDEETAFLMLLMGEPQVRARFRMVAFAMGRGAFISDLHGLIKSPRRRTPTIYDVIAKFRKLPGKARNRVIVELLQKSVLERIANMLAAPQSFVSSLTFQIDTKVCALRIEAVRTAFSLGAIDLQTYNHVTEDEIGQLRMLLFRSIMLFGRVQVDWDSLEAEVVERFRDEFEFLSLQSAKGPFSFAPETLNSIVQYLARQLSRFILVESSASVDQALSNNLRHGILLPRFMRAFQDAVPPIHYNSRIIRDWSDDAIIDHFREAGSGMVRLRNEVANQINDFMDEYLKITSASPLVSDVTERISQGLKSKSFSKRRQQLSLGPFMPVLRNETESFIRTASTALNDQVWPNIAATILEMREVCRTSDSQHILDSIETNLIAARDEASRWINIAVDRGHVKEFTIDEIVSVELLSTQASHSEQLRVNCTSIDGRRGEPPIVHKNKPLLIDGKYLGFFQEALHNLVFNAFKHSGYGLQTVLDIQFRVAIDGFTLRATNTMSSAKMKGAISSYSRIVKLAAARAPKRQKLDRTSGFERVKAVAIRTFKSDLRINIPPISEKTERFIVEMIATTAQHVVKQ
jgi:hypothetical protein